MDAEATADPCEQTVDGYDEGQDGNPVAENLACNYEAGHGSLGKAASACNAFTGASFSSSSPRICKNLNVKTCQATPKVRIFPILVDYADLHIFSSANSKICEIRVK